MNYQRGYHIILLGLLCLAPVSAEEDRLEMQGTAIIGNQELPKMLYIVPWKASELPELVEPPLGSLIDEALMPVERNVFQRQLEFHELISAEPKRP